MLPENGSGQLAPQLWQLLSPWTERQRVQLLCRQLGDDTVLWQGMRTLAKVHWCSAFVYEQLRVHQCTELVPGKIRNSLKNDCLANRLRNQLLRKALAELLHAYQCHGIAVVLLKGAATFSDDLYLGAGARTMLDLDLLVQPGQLNGAQRILVELGYVEEVDPNKAHEGLATDCRHAHINGYFKPGTPLQVELHYQVAYGQGGRVLSAEAARAHTRPADVDGVGCLVLEPTFRLLHNTVHGLIPSCDYIKGEVRLLHLVEFAYLVHRYDEEIDWQVWLQAGQEQKLGSAFCALLVLAQDLLGMPWPLEQPPSFMCRLQGYRLRQGTLLRPLLINRLLTATLSKGDRVWLWLLQINYYLHLPGWVWENVCYAEGWRNLPIRLRLLLKKSISKRSRAKI